MSEDCQSKGRGRSRWGRAPAFFGPTKPFIQFCFYTNDTFSEDRPQGPIVVFNAAMIFLLIVPVAWTIDVVRGLISSKIGGAVPCGLNSISYSESVKYRYLNDAIGLLYIRNKKSDIIRIR